MRSIYHKNNVIIVVHVVVSWCSATDNVRPYTRWTNWVELSPEASRHYSCGLSSSLSHTSAHTHCIRINVDIISHRASNSIDRRFRLRSQMPMIGWTVSFIASTLVPLLRDVCATMFDSHTHTCATHIKIYSQFCDDKRCERRGFAADTHTGLWRINISTIWYQ